MPKIQNKSFPSTDATKYIANTKNKIVWPQNGQLVMLTPLNLLNVDESYQTSMRAARDGKLDKVWLYQYCDPIVLGLRSDDGKLYIIDGCHRVAVLKNLGAQYALSRIIIGTTAQSEAKHFVEQQTHTLKISPSERFRGMVAFGDPDYCAADDLLRYYGYLSYGEDGDGIPFRAWTAIEQIMRQRNKHYTPAERLNWILHLYTISGWNNCDNHCTCEYIDAFARIYRETALGTLKNWDGKDVTREEAEENLKDVMSTVAPYQMSAVAKLRYNGDKRHYVRSLMRDIAVNNLTRQDILSIWADIEGKSPKNQ